MRETNLTYTQNKQLEFWNGFMEYCKLNDFKLPLKKAYAHNYYTIAIGNSNCYIDLLYNLANQKIACELYIPNNKNLYEDLFNKKIDIEERISKNLIWLRLEGRKASRIQLWSEIRLKDDRSNLDEIYRWLKDTAELFGITF